MKTKYILFIALLLAISTFSVLSFMPSNNIEVGDFYVTKHYSNAFEPSKKAFQDTVQVLDVKGNSIKYVGWIGWEFVEDKQVFNSVFTPCKDCEYKNSLVVKVKYEDKRK